MLQSKLFGTTLKETPHDAEAPSHQYLLRGAYIQQLASGIYTLLPLAHRVYKKIETIARNEINAIGGQELLMPSLQPMNLWKETGRFDTIDPPLFTVQDRHKKTLVLASTHEEVITDLARTYIHSYRDLPLALYQIQTKFRNEMRATGGLLRVREFIMKDLYSFHSSEEDLDSYYETVKQAYLRIYSRCGLNALPINASSGTIGGKISHEFACIAQSGEDRIAVCAKCRFAANTEILEHSTTCPQCNYEIEINAAIEVGHIFKLGKKYSAPMNATFLDEKGEKKHFFMGCYGIGLGRLLATIVEIHHDNKGICWPMNVAPFHVHLLPLQKKKDVARSLYEILQEKGIEVLFDDREYASAGEKFNDSDLLGIPLRLIISNKTIEVGGGELKERSQGKGEIIPLADIPFRIQNYVSAI